MDEEREEIELMQKRAYEKEKKIQEHLEKKHRSQQKKKEGENG